MVDGELHRAEHKPVRGAVQPQMPQTLDEWLDSAPVLETDWPELERLYRQSLTDLASLRFRPDGLTWSLPAAGLPWYMALFGRDSLIASFQALPFHPTLARDALYALADKQGTVRDDFRDEEPGKILHEARKDMLTGKGELPYSPYYGSADATLWFLILLDEYERWTGDEVCVRELEGAARAAVAWMREWGDADGDGYIEYLTRSTKGLRNQCWKDSWNSMLFADGTLAEPPIATCEIQGYAYDARVRCARLARSHWGDPVFADGLEEEALDLRERFDRDFWNEDRGIYALALDRDKRQVDSATSNMGHLLWTGIVAESRARTVAERLMSDEMHSGWGIRTMSSADAGYNPLEYHNGTVWPWDTAIGAEGLRRYGFRAEATTLAKEIVEAAVAFGYTLPEVFSGLSRQETEVPVIYPSASRPQAWSTTAPLLALRTLLGLDPQGDRLASASHLPEDVHVTLRDIPYRGRRVKTGP